MSSNIKTMLPMDKFELDIRIGKRVFMELDLEKCGFEGSGLLLGRIIPLW